MLGKTHRVGGICSGVITSTLLIQVTGFSNSSLLLGSMVIIGGAVGGLMPDIDHPNSMMGRKVKPLSLIINKIFGHRGITHTFLAMMGTSVLLFLLNITLPIAFQPFGYSLVLGYAGGYLNHLFLDSLTPVGTPFLYPFTKKQLHLGRIKTGSHELAVSMVCIVLTLLISYLILTFVN